MIKIIILGIVQGLTEFLPISSSGHLAILEKLFGIGEVVTITAFLHFGTFLAVLVFFYRPILKIITGIFKGDKEQLYYLFKIILGSIPIAIVGILFRSEIEASFKDIKVITLFLGITGVVLLLTSLVKKEKNRVSFLNAILIGISQMFAVLPGISRSGFTISAGLFSKVSPDNAFKFSFLLSLPAVFGANLLELKNISHIENPFAVIIGLACSFLSGLIALKILRGLVNRKFHLFGFYCLILSIVLLILF